MKICLIVGGSGDLGHAIHSKMEAGGWKVVPTYLSRALPYTSMHLDLMDVAWLPSWAAGFLASYGAPGAVIVASGVNEPGPAETVSCESWERVVGINLRGPFFLARELLPHMSEGGSFTFIGSVSADLGGPITPHYAASKAGLAAISRNLARAGAPRGVRSNCIEPGWVDGTWMSGKQPPWPVPLGKLIQPSEVADLVAYVVGARNLTGQTIRLDGGALMA